jgi:hypothetical protein
MARAPVAGIRGWSSRIAVPDGWNDTMKRGLIPLSLLAAFAASGAHAATEYIGICEASAGAFLDPSHFAVASDETNRLQIYERGKRQPVASADMESFTSFDKSDVEAAAAIGDRIYWISSHSFNSDGEDKPKRKLFFATTIGTSGGKPTLTGVGRPIKSLRDPLAKAAAVEPSKMDVEALAATPEGGLLIGFRKPLRSDGRAVVVPFKNPAAVVDKGDPPEFGEAVPVELEGRGFRSMDLLPGGGARYIIVAGPVSDSAQGFAVFRWSGPGSKPEEIKSLDLAGIKPEGAMAVPGQELVQLLSDDGVKDACDDEKTPFDKRKFRSIDVER